MDVKGGNAGRAMSPRPLVTMRCVADPSPRPALCGVNKQSLCAQRGRSQRSQQRLQAFIFFSNMCSLNATRPPTDELSRNDAK